MKISQIGYTSNQEELSERKEDFSTNNSMKDRNRRTHLTNQQYFEQQRTTDQRAHKRVSILTRPRYPILFESTFLDPADWDSVVDFCACYSFR